MKIVLTAVFILGTLFFAAEEMSAQGRLRLVPVKNSSEVKLAYGKKSVKVDLDSVLAGTNGTLAGEPPHEFKILFSAEKEGSLYLVVKACSGSPISNPMAPCGGDHPCAILWIKADKALKEKEFQSEIYESCSYNYYDSVVKLTRTGLTINFGAASKKKEMAYDNAQPEKGLVITVK